MKPTYIEILASMRATAHLRKSKLVFDMSPGETGFVSPQAIYAIYRDGTEKYRISGIFPLIMSGNGAKITKTEQNSVIVYWGTVDRAEMGKVLSPFNFATFPCE